MKTFKFLTVAVIALLAGGFLQSCSDDDNDGPGSAKDLVGLWEITHTINWEKVNGEIEYEIDRDDNSLRYRFEEDGTVIEYYGYGSTYYVNEEGKYKYTGGKLTITWLDDDDNSDYDHRTMTVKNLDETTLVLEGHVKYKEDGDTYEEYALQTYRKISDNN